MADFTQQSIEIRYNTDLWGPYKFAFPPCSTAALNDGVIPFGATISSVTVRAFVGNVKSSSDIDDFTEISANIIDPGYTPAVDGNTNVLVKFQYPGPTYDGNKVTLIFELTLSTSAVHPFFFQYLKVKGQGT